MPTGKVRQKRTPKFYGKSWKDGSYRVEVVGNKHLIWWRMYDPLPDKIWAGHSVYKLEYRDDLPVYVNQVQ